MTGNFIHHSLHLQYKDIVPVKPSVGVHD